MTDRRPCSRGMPSNRIWAEPDEPRAGPERVTRDVEVARQVEDLFGDLLGGPGNLDDPD